VTSSSSLAEPPLTAWCGALQTGLQDADSVMEQHARFCESVARRCFLLEGEHRRVELLA
jgi:hypothetical protein